MTMIALPVPLPASLTTAVLSGPPPRRRVSSQYLDRRRLMGHCVQSNAIDASCGSFKSSRQRRTLSAASSRNRSGCERAGFHRVATSVASACCHPGALDFAARRMRKKRDSAKATSPTRPAATLRSGDPRRPSRTDVQTWTSQGDGAQGVPRRAPSASRGLSSPPARRAIRMPERRRGGRRRTRCLVPM